MANLYELVNEYQEIEYLYNTAESDDELQQANDLLIQAEGNLVEKVENIAKLIKNLEADIPAYRNEAKRLTERAKATENKVKKLKEYAQDALEYAGVEKVNGELFNVWIQNNPPRLDIESEEQIPEEYFEPQPKKLMKKELLKDIKENGLYVDGVDVKQTRSLRIR